jgi:hypothetical protein
VSDSGRRHGSFFWVGWEEKAPRPMEFKLCLLPCRTFKHPADGNVDDWVRNLDVSPSTRRWVVTRGEVYVPISEHYLLPEEGPPQEAPVVFGYIEVSCERYTPNI